MSQSSPDQGRRERIHINRLRDWIIPRSVIGLTSMLLALAIGASVSGVALYSYYEYRLTSTDKKMDKYIDGFDKRFQIASETIEAEKQNAQAAVQKEIEPLRRFQAEGGTLASLVGKVERSVWFVQTQDEAGAPSVGTAFVVESTDRETVLVTSFQTARAATRSPGPEIIVSKGNDRLKARLDNWVEDRDLAAIAIPKGNLPKLDWVAADKTPRVGERTFAASGLGSAGASVTQGFVSDNSQNAIQHDAAVGVSFQGGPLINSDGRVTGVASMTYAPFGFQSPSGVSFAVPVRTMCEKLLRCPAGNNSGGAAAAR